MEYVIQQLKKEEWEGHIIAFRYETEHYYDFEITQDTEGFNVEIVKKSFGHTVVKTFNDRLFQSYWENAEAYGVIKDDELIAVIEIDHEEWSNRMRITELWVMDIYRRMGIGKKLIRLAKEKALEHKCRAVILETQSCNENAIAFYLSQGFSLFGFDRSCYSNNDIEKKEVRIEMGMYL